MWKWLACVPIAILATGCPDIDTDANETGGGPVVEFDPLASVVPFPNNLLLDPMTGKVKLPAQCGETPTAKFLREGVLNTLDGFGTYEPALTFTTSVPLDEASLADHIVLFKRQSGGTAVTPADAMPIPTLVRVSSIQRLDATTCATPTTVTQVAVIPLVPLDQKSTYVASVLDGVKTTDGAAFGPSFLWALVRQPTDPVTLEGGMVVAESTPLDPTKPEDVAQLKGIDLLWKAHAQAVAFIAAKAHPNNEQLLTWEFNTQTTTDPLDPMVSGSPASMVASTTGITGPSGTGAPLVISDLAVAANRATYPFLVCDTGAGTATPEPSATQCFLKLALGGAAAGTNGLGCASAAECNATFVVGTQVCASVGCQAVGSVLQGYTLSRQYQQTVANPLNPAKPVPQAWSDPVHPDYVASAPLETLIFVPSVTPPSGKFPVAVFQHGLGRSKQDAFAIAPQLTASGFAVVAIDAVAHGSRTIQISNQGPCAGAVTSGSHPECFAPFFSTNLAVARDNIRQTVLDQQTLIAAVTGCGTTACGALAVDAAHITYIGQSLGGIIGSITTAVRPDLTAAVLNVPGVGWLDVLENSATREISCPLVDGLIDAGVLDPGTAGKWNNMGTADYADDTGLCITPAWKAQPGYQQFAVIGRWILDNADPANFTKKLATRRFLIQEVVGDQVVPNIAAEREAALTGLPAMDADPGVPNPTPPPPMQPSAAIETNPMASKYVLYKNLPAAPPFPGNTFAHGSLLKPASGDAAGQLGTARMQTDALRFLGINR